MCFSGVSVMAKILVPGTLTAPSRERHSVSLSPELDPCWLHERVILP